MDDLPGIYHCCVVLDTSAEGGRDDPPVSGGHSTTAAVRPQWGLGETDRDESDVGDLGEYRPVGGMPALPSGEYDLGRSSRVIPGF